MHAVQYFPCVSFYYFIAISFVVQRSCLALFRSFAFPLYFYYLTFFTHLLAGSQRFHLACPLIKQH
ncbi:hypothetical protein DFS34DRAFT_631950 [Phlyctochytrium arcticum]|nr:hypothetical protein DFS34DRAFT_631950 [Phlyctochytrium arcticum]